MAVIPLPVGDFGPTAEAIVNQISGALGGVFAPIQLKRLARAQAEVAIIEAKAAIEVSELRRRADIREQHLLERRQRNIEKITADAVPAFVESADGVPKPMEDDWIVNFYEKCQSVSDEQMQSLWSRILATEANSPGSVSRRTIQMLAEMDKKDAVMFESVCRYVWPVGEPTPIILDTEAPIYSGGNVDFGNLTHLQSIGLINFSHLMDYIRVVNLEKFSCTYFGRPMRFHMPKELKMEFNVGKVIFTNVGLQLSKLCPPNPVDGFYEYCLDKWKTHGATEVTN